MFCRAFKRTKYNTTQRMIEDIQAVEEEHADDLAELLQQIPPELLQQIPRDSA